MMARYRELDIAIAKLLESEEYYSDDWMYQIPMYSTDLNAMNFLSFEMIKRGFHSYEHFTMFGSDVIYLRDGNIFELDDISEHGSFAETKPLAHSLAAYKALSRRDWEG